jgi:hypothetical protein
MDDRIERCVMDGCVTPPNLWSITEEEKSIATITIVVHCFVRLIDRLIEHRYTTIALHRQ